MLKIMHAVGLIALALPLAACPQLDILTGKKSDGQIQAEARIEAGLPPGVNPWHEPAEVAVVEPETVEVAVVEPTPEPVAACVEVHRVTRCVAGQPEDWYQ